MLTIHTLTFNPFEENTYIASDETGECVIIDPGCYTPEEKRELESFITSHHLQPKALLLTHAHLDHILGVGFVYDRWGLQPQLHQNDLQLLQAAPVYGEMWGFRPEPSPEPLKLLDEGDRILFGESRFDVLFTPGHCTGHIAFLNSDQRILISGDVLFKRSIGRTDLPGGDTQTLFNTIKEKLFVLKDDTRVFSGHGPVTTIGEERKFNPFFN